MSKKSRLMPLMAMLLMSVFFFSACTSAWVTFTPTQAQASGVEELLEATAEAKFSEAVITEMLIGPPREALETLTELSIPIAMAEALTVTGVIVENINGISYDFVRYDGEWATFGWSRFALEVDMTSEMAASMNFGRGALSEQLIEHNGMLFGVIEGRHLDDSINLGINWLQNGHTFVATFSSGFTLEEALNLSYTKRVNSWELDGNAVSVSIEGVSSVSLLDEVGQQVAIIGNAIYRVDPVRSYLGGQVIIRDTPIRQPGDRSPYQMIASSELQMYMGGLTLIGYRWRIDAYTGRYQYVLMPGEYSFQIDGMRATPQILVRHFQAGQVISSVDHTQTLTRQDADQFDLNITADIHNVTLTPAIDR